MEAGVATVAGSLGSLETEADSQLLMMVLEASSSVHPSAVRFAKSLRRGIEPSCRCRYVVWSNVGDGCDREAKQADVLVVYLSGKGKFPVAMIKWVEDRLKPAVERLGLLVLHRPCHYANDECRNAVENLERVARVAGVDFISA